MPILFKKTCFVTGVPFMALDTILIRFMRMITVVENHKILIMTAIAHLFDRALKQMRISGFMWVMTDSARSDRHRAMHTTRNIPKIRTALVAQLRRLGHQLHFTRKRTPFSVTMTLFTLTVTLRWMD